MAGVVFSLLFLSAWLYLRQGSQTVNSTEVNREPPTKPYQMFSVRPKNFNGDPQQFKEWTFAVELALRSNKISQGSRQVDFVSTLLEGNALLWLIACQDSTPPFQDWKSLRNALAETFGPMQSEEDNRLAMFALSQVGSLEDYIQDFIRLSLNVTGLDEHSRALLFVRGLQTNLRVEAMREHPRTLSEALSAARAAVRQSSFSKSLPKSPEEAPRLRSRKQQNGASADQTSQHRRRLNIEQRRKLMLEGKCFKCRRSGHLSKDCPEREQYPNADRQ